MGAFGDAPRPGTNLHGDYEVPNLIRAYDKVMSER